YDQKRLHISEFASWIDEPRIGRDSIEIKISQDDAHPEPFEVDLIFVCTGPGAHRTTIKAVNGEYASIGFWDTPDDLNIVSDGLRRQKVAIIGGQDGGLCDFCTLVTGERDVWHILNHLPMSD